MASGFRISLDTRAFNSTLNDYMQYQHKKTIVDVINTKLYYIARNATMTTRVSNKGRIEAELLAPSRDYPNAPLGGILVNKKLGKGQGLYGNKMRVAINKLIARRKNSVSYIRSGWKNAIVVLEKYLESTNAFRGSKPQVDSATMRKKNTEKLGKAIPARVSSSPRVYGEIENDVSSKLSSDTLELIKQDGLQKAINQEVASMKQYIEDKISNLNRATSKKLGA